MSTKYIFVTGGVVSSLGKGVTAASIGAILQSCGYRVHSRKFDPYLNADPGRMSPLQHGEVYVTEDGYETDLDLGYYERFLGRRLASSDSVSGGRIFWEVLSAERRGDYGGTTIQMIPHVSDHIKKYMSRDADADFVICEIGGTVGDIEGQIFLESARQLAFDLGRKNVMFVHLTLAPYIAAADELKTKPTQQSTRELLGAGIQADMLVVRTARPLNQPEKEKIGLFCNMSPDNVFSGIDLENIYLVPLSYEEQNMAARILAHFDLPPAAADMSRFIRIANYLHDDLPSVEVAVVGKYFGTADAYKSLMEALFHAGIANGARVTARKIDAESLEHMTAAELCDAFAGVAGIIVPGGFGIRGSAGKTIAAKFARENNIPYFGISLGMQLAAIDFMRNVCGVADADSTEFNADTKTPVVSMTAELPGGPGGRSPLRLGAHDCVIADGTLAHKIYGEKIVSERHRNRREMNPKYEEILRENGMIISGRSPDGKLPEVIEIPSHKFFIGVAFHPEFNSTPYDAHPIFSAFIKSCISDSLKNL